MRISRAISDLPIVSSSGNSALVKRHLRVLMVEDSMADAMLVEWEFKNAGYEAGVRREKIVRRLVKLRI